MNDIAAELAKLHELTGADFSRQVEHIAQMRVFHPVEGEVGIYSVGSEHDKDYNNQIRAAHKLLKKAIECFCYPIPRMVALRI